MSTYDLALYATAPGYRFDREKLMVTPIPDFFSDILAKESELAKTGENKLTAEEIESLSDKCDMSKMTSQEYKDIVDLLADKGLVERPKPLDYDPGERVCITGWQASFEPARTPTGPFNVARFLGDFHPIKKDESNFPDGNTEKPEQKAQKDREDRIQMFRIARQEGCSTALPCPFSPRGAVIFSSSSPIYDLIGISKFR